MLFKLEEIIEKYQLIQHPEGGYYYETYRSNDFFDFSKSNSNSNFNEIRNFSTQIIYCVPKNCVSKLHRIKSDETWHFYLGEPFVLTLINDNLEKYNIILGNSSLDNLVQFTIPKGIWFCGEPLNNISFSLMGCSVSPAFEFSDLEYPNEEFKQILRSKFKDSINKYI